jgi:putative intracellular protease/amidase
MEQFDKTSAISDIDATKYKVIFFAGGHGPMFDFPDCAAMNNAAAKIFENGGIVAGVCHGVVGTLIISFRIVKMERHYSFAHIPH